MNTLPIHLAPLQGYTEAAYRNAHAAVFGGVDVYHTPFVRIDRGEFRHKDVRDILPENNRVPHLIPQLIASEMDKNRANNRPFSSNKAIGRWTLTSVALSRCWQNGNVIGHAAPP